MKCGTVSASEVAASGRWDAKYHLLREEHREVYDELKANFTLEEIVALARQLPYDHEAAICVCCTMNGGTFGKQRGQGYFNEWLDHFVSKKNRPTIPARYDDVYVYVAAASQMAASKILEEMLELSKQRLEKLKGLEAILQLAADKQAPTLVKAIKHGSQEAIE